MRRNLAVLALVLVGAGARAADPQLAVTIDKAWTTPAGTGADIPLYMTIANRRGATDSLLRVRCPVAFLSEKRKTDVGEGGSASREVHAIPIPPAGTVTLSPEGYFVMLLQTREAVKQGETFTCSLTFKNAGAQDAHVTVAAKP